MKEQPVDNLEQRVAKAISRAMTVTYNGKEQAVPQFTQRAAQAAIAAVREWDMEHGYDNSLITRAATGGVHDPI